MKIEKISDTQIKFLISKKELKERNIKPADLGTDSEKTMAFLREIMQTAFDEYKFDSDNMPVIVEAIHTSGNEIALVVTKLDNPLEAAAKLNILPKLVELEKAILQTAIMSTIDELTYDPDFPMIYSFKNIDDVSFACSRINDEYRGSSSLYKKKDRYYLILDNLGYQNGEYPDMLDSLMCEYARKHSCNEFSKYHFREHGEVLVREFAVSKMSSILK